MTENPYAFQEDAVRDVAETFGRNSSAKTLLVIPTGGGKTRTAIKSILRLHEQGFFDEEESKILWVAHRGELLEQAKNAFDDEGSHPYSVEALGRTLFENNVPAGRTVLEDADIKLVVIDEAHHSAASTYLPLFRPSVGVLGLTATPSRHDGQPLEFDGESYSIGFPDMEEKGVVLRPEVIELDGVLADISGFDEASMDQLNTDKRNGIITEALLANVERFKKVIVYVGSKNHARDLCDVFAKSDLANHYQSISYVLGGDHNNSRSQTREAFFKEEKAYERSIIVNVQVLTEGYDDPTVNTVVMATPTRSKLVYMQCMGRAIRRNPIDPGKKAFVVELADELPNIKYRIDNRWIYSEISDLLEPKVVDREYSDKESLSEELSRVYDEYSVPAASRAFPEYDGHARYQLLLFKQYEDGKTGHLPILLDGENRRQVQNWFNFLSARVSSGAFRSFNREQVMNTVRKWWGTELSEESVRKNVHDAMSNSLSEEEMVQRFAPWVSFICFRKVRRTENPELDEFLVDVVNADEIRQQVAQVSRLEERGLVKFPLPLKDYVVRLVTVPEISIIDEILDSLVAVSQNDKVNQAEECERILQRSRFPFEAFLLQALPRIIRDQTIHYMRLN